MSIPEGTAYGSDSLAALRARVLEYRRRADDTDAATQMPTRYGVTSWHYKVISEAFGAQAEISIMRSDDFWKKLLRK
jgi:hypothetical protein